MGKWLIGVILAFYMSALFAGGKNCELIVKGYRVVKGSEYPFVVNKENACFFAFYTPNPEPFSDAKGNGNLGEAIWYGYYMVKNVNKIYEFPKPPDNFWGRVCEINAISFSPMHDNKNRDVTVIGSCNKQNLMNYTFPFVFTYKAGGFVLDEDVYLSLFAFLALTVTDVREYIKSPESYYRVLEERFL